MAHTFRITVEVVTERESGKFMSREEQAQLIVEQLEGNGIDDIEGGPDGDSCYRVTDYSFHHDE